MTNNPYNELPHPVFLRYVAHNDYMIDGYYLPEGVRLNAAANAIERTETLLREQTQEAIEAAFALREAKRERDEARRSVCKMSLQLGQVFRRIGGKNVEVTTPEGCAEIMRWDCFKENP